MIKYLFCFFFIFISTISFSKEIEPFSIKNENFNLNEQYNDFNRYTKIILFFEKEEKTFQIVLGSLVLTSFFFDLSIRNYSQDEIYNGSNILTDIFKGAGEKEGLFYFFLVERHLNLILQDEYLNETFLLSLQSMITTQTLTVSTKVITGRVRPRSSPDNPFNFLRGGQSYFSGHSSGAWSYLTVVATRYPNARYLAYGFATCVSLSRIYEDAHWTSDVIMGALVGYTIGKWTALQNNNRLKNILIIPYMNFDEKCVLVQYQF